MKKVIAINGSPRRKGNTATLLKYALDGAASLGAETEIINLYDLNYKGCSSCFACKKKDSKCISECVMKDELTPVLENAMQSDAIILGTPIYFNNITGGIQSFIERFLFMNASYDNESHSNLNGSINIGFIYTMNVPSEMMRQFGLDTVFELQKTIHGTILKGKSEYITSNDTYQFSDYSKYAASFIDAERKKKVRDEQFPIDCRNAFDMGKGLIE